MNIIKLAKAILLLATALSLLPSPAVRAATFTVTSTNDNSSPGSLRFAILSANSNAGPHTIDFNISGSAPFKIRLTNTLPIITQAIVVDGYSQGGANTNTLAFGNNAVIRIQLDGTIAGTNASALKINNAGCSVRGFSIINFGGDALTLQSFSATKVEGNFIGLDVDGLTVRTNGGAGIRIQNDSGDTIGGAGPGERNVISGNQGGGIVIFNGGNNLVRGNYVGTDKSGTLPRGNRGPALTIQNTGAVGNTIGGTNAAARNVFSASSGSVTNDFGIVLNSCSANTIAGNFIGTDVTGTNALGNGSGGILSTNSLGITIGGTNAGAGNIIAFNTNTGVRLANGTNSVYRNSIYSNTALGIDLGTTNVTANDVKDVDNLQNFPVITSVLNLAGSLSIVGSLNSKTNSTFRIEFFSSPSCDTNGFGEGRTFLGAGSVTTDTNGNAAINFTAAMLSPGDQVLTATATGTNGTSEFSQCRTIIPVQEAVIYVTNLGDTGPGSFRQALLDANTNSGGHTIAFNFTGGAGPFTLTPASALPVITNKVIIDGTTQNGFSNRPIVVINGGSLPGDGLVITAGSTTVRGLVINNCPGSGIRLEGGGGNLVAGNFLGTDTDGKTGRPNGLHGLLITNSPGNFIGGTNALDRNVLSQNTGDGVRIIASGSSSNFIVGNFIGMDVTGLATAGNTGNGVVISNASGNTVGTQLPNGGNLISWQSGDAIQIFGVSASNNVVQGNLIGTDATGFNKFGNSGNGITIQDAPRNQIGGTSPTRRNIITDESGSGIVISGSNAVGNQIQGNFIGADISGAATQGNVNNGIVLNTGMNLVGGTVPGAGNLIAKNKRAIVVASAINQCGILGNSIFANNLGTIDLGVGANNNQAAPVVTAATNNTVGTQILGMLNSAPATIYRVEFFASPTTGDGGSNFLGATMITTDASGSASFSVVLITGDLTSQFITATATDPFNNTSTFSAPLATASDGKPILTLEPADELVALGGSTNLTVAALSPTTLAYQWRFNGTNLPAATNSSLSFTNIVTGNLGTYAVLVGNAAGAVVSRTATLTTAGQAGITMQPMPQLVPLGSNATLSVAPIGTPPVFYQWRLNGANLPGATNATLPVTNFQLTNAGLYSVAVYNGQGVTNSDVALVSAPLSALGMVDNFDSQVALITTSGSGRASNVLATVEAGEPQPAGKPGGKSLWISWLAPSTGIATFSTAGSTFDTLLAIYTGNNVTNLVPVAADDDSGGFFRSQVQFNVDAGSLYRIAVDGLGGASGDVVLSWSLETTPQLLPVILTQPASQTVAPGGNVTFTVDAVGTGLGYQWLFNGTNLAGATASQITLPNVGITNVGSYTVKLTRTGRTVESHAALLQLNETTGTPQTVQTTDKFLDVVFGNNPLQLDGPPAFAPGFAPAAVSRGYSGSQVFSTYGATKEPGEPNHCGIAGGASQWFSYLANATGTLFMNTDGSSFDTVLAVYTGPGIDLANLTLVACDNNSGSNGLTSSLSFTATNGTLYYIAVDGVNAASGTVRLNYSLVLASRLTELGKNGAGANRVRVTGQPSGKFTLQSSTNLSTWSSLVTTNLGSGTFDYTDASSTNVPVRFYRVNGLP